MARRLLLLLFVLGLAIAASATKIQISEPLCNPATDPNTIGPSALANGFNPIGPINGGGAFTFCNGTGQDLTSILIAIRTTVDISQIDCPSGSGTNPNHLAFLACVLGTNPDAPGVIYADFVGVFVPPPGLNFPTYPGVPQNHTFTIDFTCQPNDAACVNLDPKDWPKDTTTFGYVNLPPGTFPIPPTPEPATMALLATGLGALALAGTRKVRK